MSRSEAEQLGRRHGVYNVAGLAAILDTTPDKIGEVVNRLGLRPVFAAKGDVRLFDSQAMNAVRDAMAPAEKITGMLEAVKVPLSRRR